MKELEQVKLICLAEQARAEAILSTAANSNKVFAASMLDTYRGQLMMTQKILSVLDGVPTTRYDRSDLLQWYVAARTEGWACEAVAPDGNHWERAVLAKNGYVAEINIPDGTLVVWRPDQTQIDEPTPYKKRDYTTKRSRS